MSTRIDTPKAKAAHSTEQSDSLTSTLRAPETSPSTIRKQLADACRHSTHVLRNGETVWGIAQAAGVDYRAVLKLNGLTEESARALPEGMKLRLPTTTPVERSPIHERAARTHEIQSGESIYGIAHRYGCEHKQLLRLNGLTEESARKIPVGTKILLTPATRQTETHDGDARFEVTDKTRDQLNRASKKGDRLISLDFNDCRNRAAKGIEIVIPDDATKEERKAAEAYVKGVQAFFKSHGLDRPIRAVRTRSEAGRGVRGQFHTEPFFLKDEEALRVMQKDPQGYVDVVAATLGTIKGATFMPPHKTNDPGASKGKLNERDFAKKTLIPLLRGA